MFYFSVIDEVSEKSGLVIYTDAVLLKWFFLVWQKMENIKYADVCTSK